MDFGVLGVESGPDLGVALGVDFKFLFKTDFGVPTGVKPGEGRTSERGSRGRLPDGRHLAARARVSWRPGGAR